MNSPLYSLSAALLLSLVTTAQTVQRFDIVVDELFPDPSPSIGLPNSEFIELKNRSTTAINLRNWSLSDGSSTATITTAFVLQPDSFVIICAGSAVADFSVFGRTVGVSNFPSLNNDADVITLYAPDKTVIHSVAYTTDWYQSAVKSDGGWTLEMIDPQNPCNGQQNWKASTAGSGGTPGRPNAVNAPNPDNKPPALLRTYMPDNTTTIAVFNEPLDSAAAAIVYRYSIDNTIHPLQARPLAPLFTEVALQWPAPLANKVYQLTTQQVTDCAGNTIGLANTAKTGYPSMPGKQSLVINEVLFNPKSNGYDYIELYNVGNQVTDLKQLYIANRSVTGAFANLKPVCVYPWLLFPGEYIVLTQDAGWLQQNYVVKQPAAIITMAALPSLPDDKGTIALVSVQDTVVDELAYDEKWHFALISNTEGVALERINYHTPTQDKNNWTSAAATAGFGTPGYQNSQFRADLQVQGQLSVTPAVFSPDNDGFDDVANLQYQLTEPGYVANITVFDAAGHPIRQLARNTTLAQSGTFRWDGLDDKQQLLPMGIYVVYTEIFHLSGKTKKFKNTITLARKF